MKLVGFFVTVIFVDGSDDTLGDVLRIEASPDTITFVHENGQPTTYNQWDIMDFTCEPIRKPFE